MKFTIITPYLPQRPTLTRAAACVDAQTYGDWEHIIQIDDPLKHIVPVNEDPRRKLYRCPEWHYAHTGNICRGLAFDKAEGEWIVYLDDDDILYSNALEHIAETIEANPDKHWGYFSIMRLGAPFQHYPPAGGLITGGQIFHKKYINDEPIKWTPHINYCGDWELIARCLLQYEPMVTSAILGELPEYHHGNEF